MLRFKEQGRRRSSRMVGRPSAVGSSRWILPIGRIQLSQGARECAVEGVCECLLLSRAVTSRTTSLDAGRAQSVHEVPHRQALSDAVDRVFIASRIQHVMSTVLDQVSMRSLPFESSNCSSCRYLNRPIVQLWSSTHRP